LFMNLSLYIFLLLLTCTLPHTYICNLLCYVYIFIHVGVYEEGMNWGMTTFDDFPSAVITIFQIVTLEGWSNIMYMAMDASGAGWSLFFCTIVFVGSFFVLNLVLAVLENSFTMSRDKDLASILHHQLKETKVIQNTLS
jgi:hypothetical protein